MVTFFMDLTISPKRGLEKKVVVFHLQGFHWGYFNV